MEHWLSAVNERGTPIKGYEVSSDGRVRTYWTIGPKSRIGSRPRYRKPSLTSGSGRTRYYCLCIRVARGRSRVFMLHELVAYAFLGRRPSRGYQLVHLNHERLDNRAANLQWVTRSAASRHAIQERPRRPLAKLTPRQVRRIRESPRTARELAARYGVGPKAIYQVWWGKTWGDVIG